MYKGLNWFFPTGAPQVRNEGDSTPSDVPGAPGDNASKRPGPVTGPPRGLTFERRESERRDRLEANEPDQKERRALSADRQKPSMSFGAQLRSTSSVPSEIPARIGPSSLAGLTSSFKPYAESSLSQLLDRGDELFAAGGHFDDDKQLQQYPSEIPPDPENESDALDDLRLQEEVEQRWILNLSMRFRDKSDREKFFVTFMREPNVWLRLTVSCDYRNSAPESLEADLKRLYYQRDKSSKIYDAVRESLPDITFCKTVTNLKLQTEDGRLHVHVTEDVNEVITYPELSLLHYIDCALFPEGEVYFDSHESGFVYRVKIRGKSYIKKEIPSPEAVEEFLYEINALSRLRKSSCVIKFEGLVIDERAQTIKGLVLGYAENGALVDILYDLKGTGLLPWARRVKWARQIVQGLNDIHEAGFVQGDFTLSNIVIDAADDALIIDINRRGCPVGWEPPEMKDMIEAGQKISIYIGVKTDIFQLGMVLWALAMVHDEPERVDGPLNTADWEGVPGWYAEVFEKCNAKEPQDRPSAESILKIFADAEAAGSRDVVMDEERGGAGLPGADVGQVQSLTMDDDGKDALGIAVGQRSAEFTHPAAWHVPSHMDSGFDELQDTEGHGITLQPPE